MFVGTGLLDGRVVVIIYTEPDAETIRIILLRKALSHERKQCQQPLPEGEGLPARVGKS